MLERLKGERSPKKSKGGAEGREKHRRHKKKKGRYKGEKEGGAYKETADAGGKSRIKNVKGIQIRTDHVYGEQGGGRGMGGEAHSKIGEQKMRPIRT